MKYVQTLRIFVCKNVLIKFALFSCFNRQMKLRSVHFYFVQLIDRRQRVDAVHGEIVQPPHPGMPRILKPSLSGVETPTNIRS